MEIKFHLYLASRYWNITRMNHLYVSAMWCAVQWSMNTLVRNWIICDVYIKNIFVFCTICEQRYTSLVLQDSQEMCDQNFWIYLLCNSISKNRSIHKKTMKTTNDTQCRWQLLLSPVVFVLSFGNTENFCRRLLGNA